MAEGQWYVGKGEGSYVAGPTLVLAILSAAGLPLARMTTSRWVRLTDHWLGKLSYPIYLNHYAVTIAALSLTPLRSSPNRSRRACAIVSGV